MKMHWLRWRSRLGWGLHPVELRVWNILRRRILTLGFIPLALFAPLIGAVVTVLPYVEQHHSLSHFPLASLIRFILSLDVLLWLAGIVFFALPAVISWRLAQRGAAGRMDSVYGRCFATLLDPPGIMFAHIGASRETARWYLLPLEWDKVVTPSEDQLELDVLAATGWVERIRRSGSSPGEMSRPAPTEEELRIRRHRPAPTPAEMQEEREALQRERNGEASEEEWQHMRRFARQADLGWRTSPGYIAATGWTLLAGGAVLGSFWPILTGILASQYPRSFQSQSAQLALFGGTAFFFLIGLGCVLLGVHYLRAWRRLRPLAHETPTSVIGNVDSWIPYRDTWSRGSLSSYSDRRETLISLHMFDSQRRIFRIPFQYSHIVRRRGTWVRVTYQPTTECVLDVAYAEEPVEAVPLDGPEHT